MSAIKPYFQAIPLRIRHAIKGLDNETRQAILVYLLREETPSFGELAEKLAVNKATLRAQLQILLRYGLIANFYTANSFDPKHLHYDLTKVGRMIVTALVTGSWLQDQPKKALEVG